MALPREPMAAAFTAWRYKTLTLLGTLFGAQHHVTRAFAGLQWRPMTSRASHEFVLGKFEGALSQAEGLLEAADFELEYLAESTEAGSEAGFDPELWSHVGGHVIAGEWAKVASQTAIFTEDRIRKWTGRRATEVGERLMSAVFGDGGDYRLGLTDGEKQGWHRLAMGISMALRNADAHRIQEREDLKFYAMGVLGASSLLLTQVRYEHGNRFVDTSPANDAT